MVQLPSQQAEAFLSLLWKHIHQRVRTLLHPHHVEHEAGGNDQIKIPLSFLTNVTITSPAVGQTLVINGTGGQHGATWVNGTSSGTAKHQAHFMWPLPITTYPPGPTNITGNDMTITAVQFSADGKVGGSISPGGTFSFEEGGGTSLASGLSIMWGKGVTITLSDVSQGTDGTYIAVDMAVE